MPGRVRWHKLVPRKLLCGIFLLVLGAIWTLFILISEASRSLTIVAIVTLAAGALMIGRNGLPHLDVFINAVLVANATFIIYNLVVGIMLSQSYGMISTYIALVGYGFAFLVTVYLLATAVPRSDLQKAPESSSDSKASRR